MKRKNDEKQQRNKTKNAIIIKVNKPTPSLTHKYILNHYTFNTKGAKRQQ